MICEICGILFCMRTDRFQDFYICISVTLTMLFVQCLNNSRQRSCLQYYHIHLEDKSQINYPFHGTVWINVELSHPSNLYNDFQRYSIGVTKCSELKRTCWDLVNHVQKHFSILSFMARQRSLHDTNFKCYSKLFNFSCCFAFLHHCNLIPFLLNLPIILFWQTRFWF